MLSGKNIILCEVIQIKKIGCLCQDDQWKTEVVKISELNEAIDEIKKRLNEDKFFQIHIRDESMQGMSSLAFRAGELIDKYLGVR